MTDGPSTIPLFATIDPSLFNSTVCLSSSQEKELSQEFADMIGVKHAIFCSPSIRALQLALQAIGLKTGDEVITSPFANPETVQAILSTGATPVFADIATHSYALDVKEVESKITKHTKAILPVHLYGFPADIEELMHLANELGLYLIEDCAQSALAIAGGVMAGSIGEIGYFSFFQQDPAHPHGRVGCITTNNDDLATKCRVLQQEQRKDTLPLPTALKEEIKNLEGQIETQRKAAAWYAEGLTGVPVWFPPLDEAEEIPSFYAFPIRSEQREDLKQFLQEHRIESCAYPSEPLCQPMALRSLQEPAENFPQAQQAANELLLLPMFPGISEEQVFQVCDTIRQFYEQKAPL